MKYFLTLLSVILGLSFVSVSYADHHEESDKAEDMAEDSKPAKEQMKVQKTVPADGAKMAAKPKPGAAAKGMAKKAEKMPPAKAMEESDDTSDEGDGSDE